jgi:hypothetical protein
MDIYSSVIAEIITRLTWHTTAGQTPARLLDGWTFYDRPTARIDGSKNFPALMLMLPEFSETYRARAYGIGALKFEFQVSTKTSDTLVTHTAAVALALDAVERRATTGAEVDAGLAGALYRPFEASAGGSQVTDLSLTSKVTLSMIPKAFNRGDRRRL